MSQTQSQQTNKDRPGQQPSTGQQQQQQNKPGQQAQPQGKNDNTDRAQRTPNIPGSQGVESPGREEVGRSKPGDEQGAKDPQNRKNRPDQDDIAKDEMTTEGGCGCGDASKPNNQSRPDSKHAPR